ncbi:MAG: hypothetical protein QOJ91_2821 [Sphingomonadales bacterium]|jgi:hypothetical protein|nr:hypothetical protein [Sphingomonadales bacterium]
MSDGRRSEVQGAIDWLSGPDLQFLHWGVLPPQPDYESLARHARDSGHELSPDSIREAFRLMMAARLFARR